VRHGAQGTGWVDEGPQGAKQTFRGLMTKNSGQLLAPFIHSLSKKTSAKFVTYWVTFPLKNPAGFLAPIR
jgi:hypothetical protein